MEKLVEWELEEAGRALPAPLAQRGLERLGLRQAAALATGFAGGAALLYGSLAPLGLGVVLGAGPDQVLFCAAGAVLGVLVRLQGSRAVGLLCALAAAAAAGRLLPKRFGLACAVSGGAMLAACGCFWRAEGLQTLLLGGTDWALAAAVGAVLRRSPAYRRGAGLAVLGFLWAAAMGCVWLGPIPAGLCLCGLVPPVLACRGENRLALAAAAALGAGLCAADRSFLAAAVGMSCGTLAAVLVPRGDKLPCGALWLTGCLGGALCAGSAAQAWQLLQWLALTAGAFLLTPRALLRPGEEPDTAESLERPRLSAAATRLGAVAASLTDLADTVNDVCAAMPRRVETYRWVIDNTYDSLCFNCGRRQECWQEEHSVTLDGLNALRPVLEEKESVGVEDLPGQLSRCIHPAALTAAMNRSFALYRSRQEARIHAEAMRSALTEQYGAVAQTLAVLSDQIAEPGSPEPYKSGRVAEFFASLGMPPLECTVTLDALGRTRAAVTLSRVRFREAELRALAQETGRICRRSFDPPQRLSCKGMTTLIFTEKPSLRVRFGAAGTAAKGEVSGDAVQQFCSPAAAQMILCDGMGTGKPAAVDGNLAAELTARLLKAGFTAELAARLVNVALALKSEEEGGATLDLISVDLYTGTARLFKAGAAPGFIVHGGKARAVGEASLPMGVLGAVEGQTRVVRLAAGDVAVLASDGMLVDGVGWVLQQLELSTASGDSAEQIAQTLVQMAHARARRTGRPDDITAAVLRLETA